MKDLTKKECMIITGGEYCIPEELKTGDCYVIACDHGYDHALTGKIVPDLIMGDFDSVAEKPDGKIPVISFPREKDDTDTMLAVKKALSMGYRCLHICCAFGGRLDHLFANIQTGAYAASWGGEVFLYGKKVRAVIFGKGEKVFEKKENTSLSVFALSDECRQVTITGTKYELRNEVLTSHFPMGVSNTWKTEGNEPARIACGSGIIMVMQSELPSFRT